MQVSADQLTGKFREIHEGLDEGERQAYLEALGSPSVSAERLCLALERMGHRISPSSIRTFRRRHRARSERA